MPIVVDTVELLPEDISRNMGTLQRFSMIQLKCTYVCSDKYVSLLCIWDGIQS
jgi:hypothetical protein